jgi:hypothetical protein
MSAVERAAERLITTACGCGALEGVLPVCRRHGLWCINEKDDKTRRAFVALRRAVLAARKARRKP